MIVKWAQMWLPHNVGLATTLLISMLLKISTEATSIMNNQNLNYHIIQKQAQNHMQTQSIKNMTSDLWHLAQQSKSALRRRVARSSPLEDTNVLEYLQKYGYMSKKQSRNPAANENLVSEDSFTNAIRTFQRFAGINETGLIDSETIELMRLPRCGNSDSETTTTNPKNRNGLPSILSKMSAGWKRQSERNARKRRRKRYALQGSKWRRQELTYRISQYPTRFLGKKHEVDGQIEKAFGLWSHVAPIDFIVKKEGKVHIDIRFASGEHGDGDAFDGPGNTLAHAYFPQYGGDAHFDDQEYWTIDSYAGTNIFQVAAHELGHSLGLGHSNVREALMAPFYQKYKPNFKLHLDDILAIQALYGEKRFLNPNPSSEGTSTSSSSSSTSTAPSSTSTPTTLAPSPSTPSSAQPSPPANTPPKHPTTRGGFGFIGHGGTSSNKETNDDEMPLFPDLAGNGIGAGGTGSGDDALAFQGSGTTTSMGGRFAPGGQVAADLCQDSQIDTATRTEDGNSYVFKGNFYWQLTSDGLARNFPRRIAADWDGLPGSLDASFTWADGKTFFFKGNKYWRFRNKRRDIGYPKLISAGFAGIPDDIDAAFVWSGNGRTYIFKGSQYWRYDSKADPPVSGEYPRSIKIWRGVPSYINAALKWENNVTYFFKGNQYYRFNDKEFRVESRGRPAFPRPTAEWWFGCIGSNLAAQRAMPDYSPIQYDQQQSNINYMYQHQHQNLPEFADPARPDSGQSHEWALLQPTATASSHITSFMGTHVNDGTGVINDAGSIDIEARGDNEVPEIREPTNHFLNDKPDSLYRDRDFPQTWNTQTDKASDFAGPPIARKRQFFLNPFLSSFASSSSSSSQSAISSTLVSLTSITLIMYNPTILSLVRDLASLNILRVACHHYKSGPSRIT